MWTSRASLGKAVLRAADGAMVTGITSWLDPESRISAAAHRLISSGHIAFQASKLDGLGFTMDPEIAGGLVASDARNANVVLPYLNGQDLNSRPDCSPSRWVINFGDWSEDRAKMYSECYDQVRRLVKPERDRNNRKVRRERWWQYGEIAVGLYRAIVGLKRVVVITLVSKAVMPVMVPTGQVFAHKLGVFATDDTAMLALLSSSPHYWWAIKWTSTLETRVNYSPSDVFETLPLPELTQQMREWGDRLDTYRRNVMLSRQSGLTKTYNLVHDPACTDTDIVELRAIHTAIDDATVRAYGWDDLLDELNHGFHPVAREIRYTIGPVAQREILDRLLELNHQRYAEEVAQGLHDKRKGGTAKRRGTPDQDGLFPT